MLRPSRLILAGTAIALTGACTAMPGANVQRNMSLYSIKQPVVQRADYAIDLTASYGGLAAGDWERLQGWFQSIDLRYGDRIYIDETGAYADPDMRAALAEAVGVHGLLLEEGAPVTEGQPAPGMVRLVVTRMTASVPGCPDWSSSAYLGGAISTDPNFGCATNGTLAAMIADPADLIRGRQAAVDADDETGAKAAQIHRDLVPTGTSGAVRAESAGGQ